MYLDKIDPTIEHHHIQGQVLLVAVLCLASHIESELDRAGKLLIRVTGPRRRVQDGMPRENENFYPKKGRKYQLCSVKYI